MKSWINKKLPAGSFLRNVVTLITGTTFSQGLMILIMPILTRLYSPDNFGIYALYTSILGVLSVISCWRYEIAIVLPKNDEDSANLLALSVIVCISMAALIMCFLILFGEMIANILQMPELLKWLWCLPLSLLAAGCFQAFNYWSTKHKEFKRLAIQQITLSSVTATTQISGGLTMGAGAGGLIAGSILGQTIATVRLALYIWRDDKDILSTVSLKGIKKQAYIYNEFPLYQIWAALLNTLSSMAPFFLLGYFFSPAIVGFYALGQKVVTAPMGIIARSVSQVFYPRAEIARRDGNLNELVLSIFQRLLLLGLFPIVILALIGPDLISFFFGHEWSTAGVFLRLLAPFLILNFLSSPISAIFSILHKQKEYLIFNILYLIFGVSALIYGGFKNDVLLAILLFSLIASVMYIYFIVMIFKMSGVKMRDALIASIAVLKPAICFVLPVFILKYVFQQQEVAIVFSALISVVYCIYVLKRSE